MAQLLTEAIAADARPEEAECELPRKRDRKQLSENGSFNPKLSARGTCVDDAEICEFGGAEEDDFDADDSDAEPLRSPGDRARYRKHYSVKATARELRMSERRVRRAMDDQEIRFV